MAGPASRATAAVRWTRWVRRLAVLYLSCAPVCRPDDAIPLPSAQQRQQYRHLTKRQSRKDGGKVRAARPPRPGNAPHSRREYLRTLEDRLQQAVAQQGVLPRAAPSVLLVHPRQTAGTLVCRLLTQAYCGEGDPAYWDAPVMGGRNCRLLEDNVAGARLCKWYRKQRSSQCPSRDNFERALGESFLSTALSAAQVNRAMARSPALCRVIALEPALGDLPSNVYSAPKAIRDPWHFVGAMAGEEGAPSLHEAYTTLLTVREPITRFFSEIHGRGWYKKHGRSHFATFKYADLVPCVRDASVCMNRHGHVHMSANNLLTNHIVPGFAGGSAICDHTVMRRGERALRQYDAVLDFEALPEASSVMLKHVLGVTMPAVDLRNTSQHDRGFGGVGTVERIRDWSVTKAELAELRRLNECDEHLVAFARELLVGKARSLAKRSLALVDEIKGFEAAQHEARRAWMAAAVVGEALDMPTG